MKIVLKILYTLISVGLFFLVEAFCASKMIWHYNWSDIEELSLGLCMCAAIGFDLIVFLFKHRKEPGIPAFPAFVVKFEIFIVILISCVLLGAFLAGTLETKRFVSALLLQLFVVLTKFLELTCKPRNTSPSNEPEES